MIKTLRGVLADPHGVRNKVLDQIGNFQDIKAFDGEAYKRVFPYELDEVTQRLEHEFGPIAMLGSGFRLNFGKEIPNNAIHVDEGWGTHALVLYLSKAPDGLETGTAFWPNDEHMNPWLPQRLIKEQFNKAVVYNSNIHHSRWPYEAYGDGPQNGRLIYVAFFNIINEMEEPAAEGNQAFAENPFAWPPEADAI